MYVPGKPVRTNRYAIEKFGFEEYVEEIEAYVGQGVHPSSSEILDIIDEFDAAHAASGRHMY